MGHAKLPKPPTGEYVTFMPRNDWAPEHEVYLDPFFIDKFEVTFGRFRECVDAGVCGTRGGIDRYPEEKAAYNDPAFSNWPVASAEFPDAEKYCLWKGKRLPTEAEWERAARGRKGFDYPWGTDPPSSELLSSGTVYQAETTPSEVGTKPSDVTPEGVHDLYVNVPEWVADWYDPFYYQRSPRENPTGPSEPVFVRVRHEYGEGNWIVAAGERVIRGDPLYNTSGGDGMDRSAGVPIWLRARWGFQAGFRCVRDDRPPGTPPPSGVWLYRNVRWIEFERGRQ